MVSRDGEHIIWEECRGYSSLNRRVAVKSNNLWGLECSSMAYVCQEKEGLQCPTMHKPLKQNLFSHVPWFTSFGKLFTLFCMDGEEGRGVYDDGT